jgi:ribonuclease HI
MDDAARIITESTGCTVEQANAAISALIRSGWTPPAAAPSRGDNGSASHVAWSLDDLPAGTLLTAHTDGACSGNPGPGGWAVVFSVGGTVAGEHCGSEAESTSNRMELVAVREAIRLAPAGVPLEVMADSRNAVMWLTGGYKRKHPAVIQLCSEIDRLVAERSAAGAPDVTFTHVQGHAGNVLNERADKLATGAIERARKVRG